MVPHVLALETLRQVDCHEFKVSLGFRVRPRLKKTKTIHSYKRSERWGRRERLRLATTVRSHAEYAVELGLHLRLAGL